MNRILLIAALCGLAAAHIHYSDEALADEITHLPGAPAFLPFRQFSGYIPVAADGSRKLFYWFVESTEDADKKPLTLWTNGGPGCSGLSGFISEQGPFRPKLNDNNETYLVKNEYAWNKLSNMVFIEQPAGVGFSIITGNATYDDKMAATDNGEFVKQFLARFDHFKNVDFFLSSESYGGHYLPTLAAELVRRADVPNFKGFVVGNPLTYLQYRDFGQYATDYGHQLLPLPLWKAYEANKCMTEEASDACQKITNEMGEITQDLDPYALDFPVCLTPAATGRHERFSLMSSIARAHADPDSIKNKMANLADRPYEACTDNWGGVYLNRADVKKAIHAEQIEWEECSNPINLGWNTTDIAAPMMPIYQELLKVTTPNKLRIMIYSGDDDSVCATMGSQQFLWDLGYNVSKPWAAWKVDGQTAGYSVAFEGGLHFATVHGAGHMVPSTQPARGYAIFKSFLNNYEDGVL